MVNGLPVATLAGWDTTANWEADAPVTVMLLVKPLLARPGLVARNVATPEVLSDRPVNVATPLTAATVDVPTTDSPAGPVPTTIVTSPLKEVSRLPLTSRAWI